MRFREVILHSANLNAQRSFYEETLGLEILETRQKQLNIKAGTSILTYMYAPDKPAYAYHIAFNIPENQLQEASNWLTKRAPLLTKRSDPDRKVFHFSDWNAHAIYFYDAEKNVLEFIARHNLNNGTEGAFTEHSILNVSEVGMPVPDVRQTVAILQQEAEFPVWRGGSSDMFAALGDEHGLLIVTRKGRPWMDEPTMPLPVTFNVEAIEHDFTLDGLPYAFKKAHESS